MSGTENGPLALRARIAPATQDDDPFADEQGALMREVVPGFGRRSGDPEEAMPWEQVTPRHVKPADWLRFEQSMAEIFTAFGMNLDTPGTERTPARFLKALYEATAGYEGDHKLLTAFPTECRCDSGLPGQPDHRGPDLLLWKK